MCAGSLEEFTEVIAPGALGELPATVPVRVPPGGYLEGAVAELYYDHDGNLKADIRIPGPPAG